MGKHRRRSQQRLAPSVVLGLCILSVCSPLALLVIDRPKVNEPTATPEVTVALAPTTAPTTAPSLAPTHRTKPSPTTPAKPKPSPKPPPRATVTHTTTVTKAAPPPAPSPIGPILVSNAAKYVNNDIPYKLGGNSLTTGMDCSHFVWMVLKEAGYKVPYRTSAALAKWTKRVADPQPGDLVLYAGDPVGHVGIYIGNGMMIAHGSSGGAHLQKVKQPALKFIGYGRLPVQ